MEISIYGDESSDETLLILVKEFNLLIEYGDLLKEDDIHEVVYIYTFNGVKRRHKLVVIKETYRKFHSCLKGEAREMVHSIFAQIRLSSDLAQKLISIVF